MAQAGGDAAREQVVKVAPRHVVAASIGNALEFYDFTVYAFFAIQIGKVFFPSGDPYLSLMASLGTFGAGFLGRPLGALIIGRYGDRHGRIPAMMLSMGLMGASIMMIILCPGYAEIGVAAPVIVVVSRLLQGFALGGEVGPSTAYMLEAAPPGKRGLIVGFQRASQLLANAFAGLVGLTLTLVMPPQAFEDYGWRIALGLGALIVPYALIIRRAMPELPEQARSTAEENVLNEGRYRRAIVCGFLVITGGTVGAYIAIYMTTFAQASLGLPASTAMGGQLANSLAGILASFAGGWMADRWGRRPVLVLGFGLTAMFGPLLFWWLIQSPTATTFVVATTILSVLGGIGVTAAIVAIIESIPHRFRASAFALVYTLPVTIFGGTTQLVVTWLIKVTGTPMAVAGYSSAAMLLAVAAMLAMRESAPARRGLVRA